MLFAGTGWTARFFKDAGFKGQVDGIEMSSAMLNLAVAKKGLYRQEPDPREGLNPYSVLTSKEEHYGLNANRIDGEPKFFRLERHIARR